MGRGQRPAGDHDQGSRVRLGRVGGLHADDEHDPEGQTIAYERSQLSALIRVSHEHLAEIDSAIARLEHGDYGTCAVCFQPIPAARLEARPTALICVQHADIDTG